MNLMEVIELSTCGVVGIGAILSGGVGILQGHYNFEKVMDFYNKSSEDVRNLIGPPNKNKIYFQSILNAPRFMYNTLRNKQTDDVFTNYVAPVENYQIK